MEWPATYNIPESCAISWCNIHCATDVKGVAEINALCGFCTLLLSKFACSNFNILGEWTIILLIGAKDLSRTRWRRVEIPVIVARVRPKSPVRAILRTHR